jgi:hypothetical protein
LRRGRIVALRPDGDRHIGGVKAKLSGCDTMLPRVPAAPALKTNVAVGPGFAIRIAHRKIMILIEEGISISDKDEVGLTGKIV